jgi:hypothetical protein
MRKHLQPFNDGISVYVSRPVANEVHDQDQLQRSIEGINQALPYG